LHTQGLAVTGSRSHRALRGLAAALVAAALGFPAAEIPAAEPSRVVQAEAKVRLSSAALRKSEADLAGARTYYDQLGRKIAALKKGGAKSGEPALERLLQDSIEAQKKLEALAHSRDTRAAAVRTHATEAIRSIDAEIARLKPGLTEGSPESRTAVARTLKELLDTRNRMRDALAFADAGAATPERAWTQYEVRIDPLDGPSELREKADFLEDTRDKLTKKRGALDRILREARQEHEIARAASSFQRDARHFDEVVRSGRVTRQRGGGGSSGIPESAPRAAANADTAGKGTGVTGGAGGAGQPAGAQSPPPQTPQDGNVGTGGGGGGEPSRGTEQPRNPNPGPQSGGSFGGAVGETESADADDASSPTSRAPAATFTGVPTGAARGLAKQIDPDVLLNLRVEDLDGSALDMEELEKLVSELERLDAKLSARAQEIRRRAKALEEDEARTLGHE
jgi:hypothetical protein